MADVSPLEGPAEKIPDDLDMNELFGSSSEDEDVQITEALPPEAVEDQADDNDDEGKPEDEEQRAHNPIMNIPTSLHPALPPSQNHLAKLPASLRIVSEAFREEEFDGKNGRSGDEKNTVDVRWRYGLDASSNKLRRESNARIVTWSDGSQTLHVGGNAAVYNIKTIDIDKDETFLYANVQRLIQCQGKLRDKLMFNPISVKQVASRPKNQTNKSIKVRQTATLVDPVKEREAKQREEEARIKEKEKLLEKQRQMQRNAILNDPNFARRRYQGSRDLSAAFLEEDDDADHRVVNEDEYEDDDGWLVDEDDEDHENDDELEDAEDAVNEASHEEDVGINGGNEGGEGRTMPTAEAEQRNEAALMNIMAEGKANDQGDKEAGAKPNEAKKRKVLISSDSDDD